MDAGMRQALLTTADDAEAFAAVVERDENQHYCNYRNAKRGYCLLCAESRDSVRRVRCCLCPIDYCLDFIPPGMEDDYSDEHTLPQPARVAWWKAAAVRLRELANAESEG